MNVYEGVQSEILYTTKFGANSHLDTTCLGRKMLLGYII